tara:strand:- start:263 stop:385 length:123 start_codon:yes stop_codon:yes gene_type:complete
MIIEIEGIEVHLYSDTEYIDNDYTLDFKTRIEDYINKLNK